MASYVLSVRELSAADIELIANYWFDASPAFLEGMGVDLAKLPTRIELTDMLREQLRQPVEQKKSYCLIWEVDGQAAGHSNINKIVFGEEAYMHLHLWQTGLRQKGLGTALVKLTIPHFFETYQLKTLYCEPYALNPAPNKTLAQAGFEFVGSYVTVPGWINFEQEVNLWKMEGASKGKSGGNLD